MLGGRAAIACVVLILVIGIVVGLDCDRKCECTQGYVFS